jgi:hypothetical protein
MGQQQTHARSASGIGSGTGKAFNQGGEIQNQNYMTVAQDRCAAN